MSRTQRKHLLRLAALEVSDEVEGEAVAPASVLLREVLRDVLADQLDAGVGERAELIGRDVLRGREQLDLGGVAAGARAR